jgi:rhodanese-related sulfurtransferase
MNRLQLFILSPVILALAACGGEVQPSKHERKGSGAPFGFELAMAATSEAAKPQVVELSPDEVARELARGSIRLIDIRTDAEIAEDASIPGAEHVPMDRLDTSILESTDGREVVLYCRSGRRSEMAAAKLAEQTGTAVTHMPGGILAWQERVRMAACQQNGQKDC